MAIITIHNYCSYIQMAGKFQVVVPSDFLTGAASDVSTLFLLAPEGEDGSAWLRHAQVELLADQYQMVMVLIPCLQGCYTDMAFGYQFFQSLAHGVPDYLRRMLPTVPLTDGKCFVAGPSMGGMGAVKLALTQTARFAAAASFSGRLDNYESFKNPVEGDWLCEKRMINLWGSPEAIPASENDLQALLGKAVISNETLPDFYIAAGSEDIGVTASRVFASDSRVRATVVKRQGIQGWSAWANELEQFLAWCERKRGE